MKLIELSKPAACMEGGFENSRQRATALVAGTKTRNSGGSAKVIALPEPGASSLSQLEFKEIFPAHARSEATP